MPMNLYLTTLFDRMWIIFVFRIRVLRARCKNAWFFFLLSCDRTEMWLLTDWLDWLKLFKLIVLSVTDCRSLVSLLLSNPMWRYSSYCDAPLLRNLLAYLNNALLVPIFFNLICEIISKTTQLNKLFYLVITYLKDILINRTLHSQWKYYLSTMLYLQE